MLHLGFRELLVVPYLRTCTISWKGGPVPDNDTERAVRNAAEETGLIRKGDDETALLRVVDAYSVYLAEQGRVPHQEVCRLRKRLADGNRKVGSGG